MGKSKVIAIVIAAVVSLAGCGTAEGNLSDVPGCGKWVDSDVKGTVKADDVIRLQDDYAAAVNQDWIVNAPHPENTDEIAELIIKKYNEVLDDRSITGKNADVMRTFRDLYYDWDERSRLGAEPLRKYLKTIESIDSLDAMTEYQGSPEKNPFGLGLMMPSKVDAQIQFVDRNTLYLSPPSYSLQDRSAYLSFSGASLEAKEKNDYIVSYILGKLGYEERAIDRILKENYEIETALAKNDNGGSDGDFYSAGENFRQVQTTREGLSAYVGTYPLFEILDARGYGECDSLNADYMYLASLGNVYTEQNLEALKSFLTVHLVNATRMYFDRDTMYEMLEAERSKSQKDDASGLPGDDYMFSYTLKQSGYGPLMDTLYVNKYYPDEESIAPYMQMVESLIDSYRVMLNEEDWISGDTRKVAKEKLENMAVHLIRPDNEADYTDVDIKGYDEGGSLLDAAAEGRRELNRHFAEMSKKENVDRYFWDIYDASASATENNCFYMPSKNGIYILAGWFAVAEYLFGEDATEEQILGCIGAIVGHEISHGFDADGSRYDKNGAIYDENGDQTDWMSVDDRSRLNERADALAAYFTLARPIPGKKQVNGQNVKNEAMADMAGIKAVLYMARDIPDFDYDGFFRAYAAVWRDQVLEEVELSLMDTDIHPLNFYRININLQQFEEFYDTYGIRPGDGMYLAPEKRISVW
ncbi:MAG: M13 family metallopeptidase [Lachnospiraceae bacterium]|nr:M13 family metallopeptidase [Lachnospiraceae bacterium]